jgi:hypothetical protein
LIDFLSPVVAEDSSECTMAAASAMLAESGITLICLSASPSRSLQIANPSSSARIGKLVECAALISLVAASANIVLNTTQPREKAPPDWLNSLAPADTIASALPPRSTVDQTEEFTTIFNRCVQARVRQHAMPMMTP